MDYHHPLGFFRVEHPTHWIPDLSWFGFAGLRFQRFGRPDCHITYHTIRNPSDVAVAGGRLHEHLEREVRCLTAGTIMRSHSDASAHSVLGSVRTADGRTEPFLATLGRRVSLVVFDQDPARGPNAPLLTDSLAEVRSTLDTAQHADGLPSLGGGQFLDDLRQACVDQAVVGPDLLPGTATVLTFAHHLMEVGRSGRRVDLLYLAAEFLWLQWRSLQLLARRPGDVGFLAATLDRVRRDTSEYLRDEYGFELPVPQSHAEGCAQLAALWARVKGIGGDGSGSAPSRNAWSSILALHLVAAGAQVPAQLHTLFGPAGPVVPPPVDRSSRIHLLGIGAAADGLAWEAQESGALSRSAHFLQLSVRANTAAIGSGQEEAEDSRLTRYVARQASVLDTMIGLTSSLDTADPAGGSGAVRAPSSAATTSSFHAPMVELVSPGTAGDRRRAESRCEQALDVLRASGWDARATGIGVPECIMLQHLARVLHRLGRTQDALPVLDLAAGILIAAAPICAESADVLEAGAEVLDGVDGVDCRELRLSAALVYDGLRLQNAFTGEGTRADLPALRKAGYERVVTAELDAGDDFRAFDLADRARGRTFLEARRGRRHRVVSVDAAWVERFATLPDELLEALPAQPVARLSEVVHLLVQFTYNRLRLPVPLTGDDLLAAVLAFTTDPVVLLQSLPDELVFFVAGAGRLVTVVRTPQPRTAVTTLTSRLRQALGIHMITHIDGPPDPASDRSPDLDALLRDAYWTLYAPIETAIGHCAAVTLVPDETCGALPWSMFRRSDGRHLVELVELSTCPSFSTMHALRTSEPSSATAVYVAADPKLGPADRARGLGPLPGGRADAGSLRSLFTDRAPRRPLNVRIGADATSSSYMKHAPSARIVHLACHASVADPVSESCLHLASEDAHGGRLTAAEVAEIRLDGAIVFLAACDSGLGRASSDGVVGLGSAFLVAGARAVVLTLWKVADVVASQLTHEFYRNFLVEPGVTLRRALTRATVSTRRALKEGAICDHDGTVLPDDSALWGAFFILGDGEVTW